MLRTTWILWALLCLILCSTPVAAEEESLAERALPGEQLVGPSDPTALSQRFLEWHYLGEWVRSRLLGGDSEHHAQRWSRLVDMRAGFESPAAGELERRRRGQCVFEELDPTGPELLTLCDSLNAGRYRPSAILVEGMLQAYLLRLSGLPGCGVPGDPTERLQRTVEERPTFGLEELKEGVDFPAFFFAAEREVEKLNRNRLEPVRQMLEQDGLLITLRYGFLRQFELNSPVPPNRIDEGKVIYPDGLDVDWGKGRRLSVRGLSVLHSTEQNLFQVVEPGIELKITREGESFGAEFGEFSLDGAYLFETRNVSIDIVGGRYRRDGRELRLWLPNSVLSANRNSFLYSLLILLVTGYLLLAGRRKRRELQASMKVRRPRP